MAQGLFLAQFEKSESALASAPYKPVRAEVAQDLWLPPRYCGGMGLGQLLSETLFVSLLEVVLHKYELLKYFMAVNNTVFDVF